MLAGGRSLRMGREKGKVLLKGKPLIQYSLDVLAPFCDEIIISANSGEYKSFGYPVVTDEVPGTGPLGGLYSALRRTSHRGNLVLPCDTPFLNTDFIRFLLASVLEDHLAVIPLHPDGTAEPLCGYYTKDNIPLMKESLDRGQYKLLDYLSNAGAFFLPFHEDLSFYHTDLFININSPEDLEKYEK